MRYNKPMKILGGTTMNVYNFTVKNAKNEDVSLRDYANKVLLIVNTATKCGYTPQYEELEQLQEKYGEKGFLVLDFPCNQFLHQAPGSIDEIVEFCKLKYHATFPIFQKIDVNGPKADPLFEALTDGKKVKWNFTKFLIDRSGNLVKRFEPADKPFSFETDITNLL
jgi:glutathione peroxidase